MASAETYEPIYTHYVSGSDTVINFTSIPQTYTHLVIASFHGQTTGAYYWLQMQVGNGSIDTGNNYSGTTYGASASTKDSSRYNAASNMKIGGSDTNQKSTNVAYLFDYTNTTTWKSSLASFGFANSSIGWAGNVVNTWKNTAAINTIRLTNENGATFAGDSIITLYGVKKA